MCGDDFWKFHFSADFRSFFIFLKYQKKSIKLWGHIYLILSIYMASTSQRGVKTKTHMSKFQKCTLMAKSAMEADRPFGVRGLLSCYFVFIHSFINSFISSIVLSFIPPFVRSTIFSSLELLVSFHLTQSCNDFQA